MTFAEAVADTIVSFCNLSAAVMGHWVNLSDLSNVTLLPAGEELVNYMVDWANGFMVVLANVLQELNTATI